ncbi:MAG: hypothetical protein ATN33_08635 [Epulopiscium sp. Nele67-Bin001]|nr:MAG: hypothetical protein ATN33_08635 [Epulopiscium sp. Nele67-Bin001]
MKTPISEHIFLLPFAWTLNTNNKGYNFKPQEQIKSNIFDHIQGWRKESFFINSDETYNEFVYFYKPVRTMLYPENSYSYAYVNDNSNCLIYVNNMKYNLKIRRINLKFVKSGIGILSIYLENYTYNEELDIRAINSVSDCVYPLELPLKESTPKKIVFNFDNFIIQEDMEHTNYRVIAGKISPFIMDLFGPSFVQTPDDNKPVILIEPLMGSKMVTLCLFKSDITFKNLDSDNTYQYKQEFTLLEQERHYLLSSFLLLCISKSTVESKLYDQMMCLLLIQKASLLNFSNQIADISMLPKDELVMAIETLYEIYIQFINQMFFDEVTEDEKGSWVYQNFTKIFNIKEEISQMDFEMKEVHEYAELITRQQSNIKMEILSLAGAGLVIPTFVTGFFGMNILGSDKLGIWWKTPEVLRWLNAYVALPVLIILYYYTWSRRRSRRLLIMKIALISCLAISLFVLIKYGGGTTSQL